MRDVSRVQSDSLDVFSGIRMCFSFILVGTAETRRKNTFLPANYNYMTCSLPLALSLSVFFSLCFTLFLSVARLARLNKKLNSAESIAKAICALVSTGEL